jgi:hypothetical protein
LKRQAAEAKAAATAGKPASDGDAPDASGLKNASAVTFSAAALLALGGGGPQERMLRVAEQQRGYLKEIKEINQTIARNFPKTGFQ